MMLAYNPQGPVHKTRGDLLILFSQILSLIRLLLIDSCSDAESPE